MLDLKAASDGDSMCTEFWLFGSLFTPGQQVGPLKNQVHCKLIIGFSLSYLLSVTRPVNFIVQLTVTATSL